MNISCEQDPYDKFDVEACIEELYAEVTAWNVRSLKVLHDFYHNMNTTGLKYWRLAVGQYQYISVVPYHMHQK